MRENGSVFMAHPVSDYQHKDGMYREEKKLFLQRIVEALQNNKINVLCAATNENYGETKLEYDTFTRYDIESISEADLFVLVTTERLSRDMYLEIGYALGLKKPIHLFVPFSAYRRHFTYMLLGLERTNQIQVHIYERESDLPAQIATELSNLP